MTMLMNPAIANRHPLTAQQEVGWHFPGRHPSSWDKYASIQFPQRLPRHEPVCLLITASAQVAHWQPAIAGKLLEAGHDLSSALLRQPQPTALHSGGPEPWLRN